MRAAFLHGKAAVAVWERLGGAAEPLLSPVRLGQRAAGVDGDVLALDVDLAGLLPVAADGGVVEAGVVGCRLAAEWSSRTRTTSCGTSRLMSLVPKVCRH